MDVTLSGIVTEARFAEPEKALAPMDVTFAGIEE
jgi:hypothetical protein